MPPDLVDFADDLILETREVFKPKKRKGNTYPSYVRSPTRETELLCRKYAALVKAREHLKPEQLLQLVDALAGVAGRCLSLIEQLIR